MSKPGLNLTDKISLAFVLVPSSLAGIFTTSWLHEGGFHPAWSLIGGIVILAAAIILIGDLACNLHPMIFGLFYGVPIFFLVLLNVDFPWSVFWSLIAWAIGSASAFIFRETLNELEE